MRFDLIILIIILSSFTQVDEITKGMPTHGLVITSGYSSDTQLTDELISVCVEDDLWSQSKSTMSFVLLGIPAKFMGNYNHSPCLLMSLRTRTFCKGRQ